MQINEKALSTIQSGLARSGEYESKAVAFDDVTQARIFASILDAMPTWTSMVNRCVDSSTTVINGWNHFIRLKMVDGEVVASVLFESHGYGDLKLFRRTHHGLHGVYASTFHG